MCIRDRGVYVTDGYRDTVEDGIAIVKEYIEGSVRQCAEGLANLVV